MEQQNLFKGRDRRKKGWFWLDNDYLNGWAKYFGAIGTAIYVSLCRHADNETQKCFPAQSTIAEELGISERTVRTYLKHFEKYNLIAVEREKDFKTKKWLNNVYILIDKSEWIKPEAPVACGTRGKQQQKPEATDDTSQRHQLPNKETHINKTNNKEATPCVAGKEINDLIELFKGVNPNYEQLFKNKNQRGAVERMVAKFGYEKMKNGIEYLPKIVGIKYAPTITTPIQLETKMGDLIGFIKKERSSSVKNKIEIIK